MRDDLRRLGKIRNEFAHQWRVIRFGTPKIEKLCHDLAHGDLIAQGQNLTARERYLKVVKLLSGHMTGQAAKLQHQPPGKDFRWMTWDTPASAVVAPAADEED